MVRFPNWFGRRHRDDAEALRERVARFRHLLAMNSRVLRLISEANEKLGGEYLFDAQYLRTLATELGDAVTAVVHDLGEMSGNRYPALASALERVRSAVQASLDPRRNVQSLPLTLAMDELGTDLADIAGEKMARLAEIRRHLAIRVPDGFVITARACDLLLACPAVAAELQRFRDGRETSTARLRAAISAAKVPAEVSAAVKEALGRFRRDARFAVRSSALGEDGEHTFAGQHATLLNVPRDRVLGAWLEVVASLFSERAVEYRRRHGLMASPAGMAVGCLLMVQAVSSGVTYTVDPTAPHNGVLIISATRGLGIPVVGGSGVVDEFRLSRTTPHRVIARGIADKREMSVAAPDEGTTTVAISAEQRTTPALDEDALARLAEIGLRIERYTRCPQDIEWALDEDGEVFVLQARPLRIGPEMRPRPEEVLSIRKRHRVLMEGRGEVACRGVGIGPVFVVDSDERTEGFAPGHVLVARVASPRLAPLVATASAVVTDLGSVTGHLATVAREYRVPAIVGAREATRLLAPGKVITVDADENTVYDGSVEELFRYQILRSEPYEETPEFRVLRRMLRHVSPLSLRDPTARDFAPENCRTYHDIIRFAHERALDEMGRLQGIKFGGRDLSVRPLELSIPLDLLVIDLGGGIAPGARGKTLTSDQVTSRPLVVLLEGLLAPGVWSTIPADMDLEGFMASATRAGPLTTFGAAAVPRNVAIVAADYLNLNLRLGYHFNVVDCYLGEAPEDNYIFFRFVGGVTDITRRTRRARLLAAILARQEFKVELVGELVIGRLQGVPSAFCEERLRTVGRLIGFSRQLDILLRDDRAVDRLVDAFLQGRYQETPDVFAKENDDASGH